MSINITGAAQGGNLVLSRAGGATANISGMSGAASTYTIQNVTFANQGKLYYKATAAGAATPTTDVNTGAAFKVQAANTACAYLWAVNAAGTVQVAQGPVVSYTDTSANSTRCPLPGLPDASTPLAYAVIKNGSTGSAWTFGSSNWNATGITVDTPVDLFSGVPADPLTA